MKLAQKDYFIDNGGVTFNLLYPYFSMTFLALTPTLRMMGLNDFLTFEKHKVLIPKKKNFICRLWVQTRPAHLQTISGHSFHYALDSLGHFI